MIGVVALVLVLTNISCMLFCFKDEKNVKEGKPQMKLWNIILMASLFSALGALLCTLAFGYRKNDKKYLLIMLAMLAAQIAGITLIAIYLL